MGKCWLKRPPCAQVVADAMHHFDGERYELGCYVVMPNHVHTVIRPLHPQEFPLEKTLHSIKRHSSLEINSPVGTRGALWQDESFDRIIRDEEHLWRCLQYIGRNPNRAGLSSGQWRTWVRPDWSKRGWVIEAKP